MWRPLVSVITTLYNVATICHCQVAFSLRYVCIRSLGIILIPLRLATFVPNLVSVAAFIAELAHGKNHVLNHSLNQSPSLYDAPGTKAFRKNKELIQFNKPSQ